MREIFKYYYYYYENNPSSSFPNDMRRNDTKRIFFTYSFVCNSWQLMTLPRAPSPNPVTCQSFRFHTQPELPGRHTQDLSACLQRQRCCFLFLKVYSLHQFSYIELQPFEFWVFLASLSQRERATLPAASFDLYLFENMRLQREREWQLILTQTLAFVKSFCIVKQANLTCK